MTLFKLKKSINFKHETHKETVLKFIGIVALLTSYFIYMTFQYDIATGGGISMLTWSFFVLCTPIADGGFIIAFPIRLLFGIRMLFTQIMVWFIAVGANVVMLAFNPQIYELTLLTSLLKQILTEPYPYWSILLISLLGTLLSIYLGDEMIDVTSHKERHKHHRLGLKYRISIITGLALITIFAYYQLLADLKVNIPS